MSEVTKNAVVEETTLPEEALALDPMNPDPDMAMPDHAPGAIMAKMAGNALERGQESAGKLAAPAGLALATAGCSQDTLKSLESRPGEGGWAYLFRLILENPKSAIAIALIIGGALFGIRKTLKGVGSLLGDGIKATGRFLIAANERGAQNQITPGSLKDILTNLDENNATPAMSMMQPAGRARITELDRALKTFFTNLRFNDQGSGTALYENIIRLAYIQGLLEEIGDGTFAMPGAPAAAPVPVGPHRGPRHGHPAAAPAAGGRTLDQRRDNLLADYERIWQALATDNLTITAADGFEANLQALVTTIGTTYRLTAAEQANLRQAITTFLSSAPYYRPNVDGCNALTDRHRRLLTGEFKRSAVTPPRTRANTVLTRFPAGAPGPLGTMAQQVDHGRAEIVDRVATVIDGNVPRRRRVRDTIVRGGALGRGGLAPRGTWRGYVGDISARSFVIGGNAWAALQAASLLVGAGEPAPARPDIENPPAVSTPVEAARETSAEKDREEVKDRAATNDTAARQSAISTFTARYKEVKRALANPKIDPQTKKAKEEELLELKSRLEELGVNPDEITLEEPPAAPVVPAPDAPDATTLSAPPEDATSDTSLPSYESGTSGATGKTPEIEWGK